MKPWMIAALTSATLTASAASVCAQGYRVEGPNEGGSSASVRPSGGETTPQSAQGSSAESPAVAITNTGSSGRASVTARPTRERAWWEYAGVTPGSSEYAVLRRWARRRSRDGRVVVAWPGFQMTESGSRVFLAVSSAPRVTSIQETGKLVYRLERASVPIYNNRRTLETAAFATPVSRAYLRLRRGSVDLVIELRGGASAQPQTSQQAGPDGISFLMFEFGRYAAPAESPTTSGATQPRTATTTSSNTSGQGGIRPAAQESSPTSTGGRENPEIRANGRDDERPPAVVR
ncbi:MAG: hypothetical protein JNK05_28820 [Myxococcales bacterium]|nr:hypothetical protein [Myxococcales bacterium]